MWVEAILSKDDLAGVINDLCPLTIRLGQDPEDDHFLRLSQPENVSLVEDVGLRFTCHAEIRWPVLGIDVPIAIQSITLTLNPALAPATGEHVLAFRPQIEQIDLSWLPDVIDQRIADKINVELEKKHVELSWRFAETLSHRFALPNLLLPVSALDVEVAWGKVRVTSEAMVMAVSFHTRVIRGDEGVIRDDQGAAQGSAMVPVPDHAKVVLGRSHRRDHGIRISNRVAAVAATALAGATAYFAIGAMTWLWRTLRRSA
jgi:hypothetical protein